MQHALVTTGKCVIGFNTHKLEGSKGQSLVWVNLEVVKMAVRLWAAAKLNGIFGLRWLIIYRFNTGRVFRFGLSSI